MGYGPNPQERETYGTALADTRGEVAPSVTTGALVFTLVLLLGGIGAIVWSTAG